MRRFQLDFLSPRNLEGKKNQEPYESTKYCLIFDKACVNLNKVFEVANPKFGHSEIGYWNLFGIWNLVFGI